MTNGIPAEVIGHLRGCICSGTLEATNGSLECAFLLAHHHDCCGEAVEVQRLGKFVGLLWESCGEQWVLEVVDEQTWT